ncbi:hypothetical protein M422DRAFT_776274 [Sphaerobolus stellatus SS14]|nr:hypothetical protein M422DRAFT_776274 [Sphaerobolus stellatus SS14]
MIHSRKARIQISNAKLGPTPVHPTEAMAESRPEDTTLPTTSEEGLLAAPSDNPYQTEKSVTLIPTIATEFQRSKRVGKIPRTRSSIHIPRNTRVIPQAIELESNGRAGYQRTVCTHPEGSIYFMAESTQRLKIFTDADLTNPKTLGLIEEATDQLLQRAHYFQGNNEIGYYFVESSSRSVFWLGDVSTENARMLVSIDGVTSLPQIRFLIEGVFWLVYSSYQAVEVERRSLLMGGSRYHCACSPHSGRVLALGNVMVELENYVVYALGDIMMSISRSNSPYSKGELSEILPMLNKMKAGVDEPALDGVLRHALREHRGVTGRVQDDERRGVARRERRDGLEGAVLCARRLRSVPNDEMIGRLLRRELRHERKDTIRIARQHDNVLRLRVHDAGNPRVRDELDRIRTARVFGDGDIVVVGDARRGVVQDVLEEASQGSGG